MKTHRLARVAEVIREVASETILFELRDPRVKGVTVTRAEVSADLQHAKVFVSIMGTPQLRRAAVLAVLVTAAVRMVIGSSHSDTTSALASCSDQGSAPDARTSIPFIDAAPEVPDAPTHASLVKAKYGDNPPRQPRPNPNRGDNVTGGSPYQDSAENVEAEYPSVV